MSVAWTEQNTGQRGMRGPKLELAVNYSEAREALNEELFRHPSVLGRLVAIAELWDAQSGRYCHKLAAQFGTEETDRVLRRLHQEIFVAWLGLPLRQQQADVSVYLSTVGGTSQWFDFQGMARRCVPKTATLPEKDLFVLDLQLIQSLQRY